VLTAPTSTRGNPFLIPSTRERGASVVDLVLSPDIMDSLRGSGINSAKLINFLST
jgi:hypothetical protein